MKLKKTSILIFSLLFTTFFLVTCITDSKKEIDFGDNNIETILLLRDSIKKSSIPDALKLIDSVESSGNFNDQESSFFLNIIKISKGKEKNKALGKLLDLEENLTFEEKHIVNKALFHNEVASLLSNLGNYQLAAEYLKISIENLEAPNSDYDGLRCELITTLGIITNNNFKKHDESLDYLNQAEIVCSDVIDINVFYLKNRAFRGKRENDSALLYINKAIKRTKEISDSLGKVDRKYFQERMWNKFYSHKVSLLYMLDDEKREGVNYKDSIRLIFDLANKQRQNKLMSEKLYNNFITPNLNSLTKLKEYDKVRSLIPYLEKYYSDANASGDNCYKLALINMSKYVLAREEKGYESPIYGDAILNAYNFMDNCTHHEKKYFSIMWSNVLHYFYIWYLNTVVNIENYENAKKIANLRNKYKLANEKYKLDAKLIQLTFWKERERNKAKKVITLNQEKITQTKSKLRVTNILLFTFIIGLVIFYFLFSKIKKQKSELEQKSKMLENFAFIAAHDLKEPLANISTINNIISKKYSEIVNKNDRRFFEYINKSTKGLKDIINALINISKTEITQINDSSIVYLNNTINTSIELLQEDIDKSKATINIKKLPEVIGDTPLLNELFLNLILNAIKFAKKNIPLEINVDYTTPDENYFCISFQDNGIGMSKKSTSKIFEMNEQLQDQKGLDGLGLGLYICKEIIKLHKGTIWVESEEGVGSTFYFTLRTVNN